jgi:hypothetical protein
VKDKIITICAWCKKTKDNGKWITKDIPRNTDNLSHGCCPECIKKYHPTVADKVLKDLKIE